MLWQPSCIFDWAWILRNYWERTFKNVDVRKLAKIVTWELSSNAKIEQKKLSEVNFVVDKKNIKTKLNLEYLTITRVDAIVPFIDILTLPLSEPSTPV